MGYIYLATNTVNGKQYVGKTKYDIHTRWIQHKCEARRLIPNVYFIRALHKYGIDNFSVNELEQCEDSELLEREKYYIQLYDTYKNGYNSTLGGEGNHKFETQEILQLWNDGFAISEIARELGCSSCTVSTALHSNSITVFETRSRGTSKLSVQKKITAQYDLNGNLIKVYDSVVMAAKELGLHENTIRSACNGRTSTAANCFWLHFDNLESVLNHIDIIKPLEKTKRPISQYDLNGNLIKNFNSIKEAAEELKVCYCAIQDALTNKSCLSNGFLWKYQNDPIDIMEKVERNKHKKDYRKKKIIQYTLQNEFITNFDSAASAAEAIGKSDGSSSIIKACRGKLKTAYGYKWSYAES